MCHLPNRLLLSDSLLGEAHVIYPRPECVLRLADSCTIDRTGQDTSWYHGKASTTAYRWLSDERPEREHLEDNYPVNGRSGETSYARRLSPVRPIRRSWPTGSGFRSRTCPTIWPVCTAAAWSWPVPESQRSRYELADRRIRHALDDLLGLVSR